MQFNGGIILPRDNAQGVPITTVNITKLKIKLIRVGDRLLSQIESGTVDETTLYSWSAKEVENNQGSLVWQGTMDVANVKNDTVVTLIPIHDVLKNKQARRLCADRLRRQQEEQRRFDEDYDSGEMAVQWVVDSDIALTTFKGAGGLDRVRALLCQRHALVGVKLTLVARDNNEVATAKTDSDGRADFDAGLMRAKGGDEPVVVMAYGDDRISASPICAAPASISPTAASAGAKCPDRSMRSSTPNAASIAPARRFIRRPCCATASAPRPTRR